ncbi:ABC transporter ATP-binding protein [Chryseotalea sanaruensis]|uniref:ABC transporter ATP-binding protein n=1 Tax=Chryseotalea sanaruensis TaxID=2482724 RepID=A0A401U9F2_9BACT|nr:ATP-binding cassette domain-containing protein [Chryseotalea sanaruensis]GCC51510.1 ABC transporter ATP-binding protein [Chryseotalea sanaruensis]
MANLDTYLQTEKLGKRFNREWIFKELTYRFNAGKTYAITGPNGSGKSTLLQVLWGQVPSSAGTLSYKVNGIAQPIDNIFEHVSIATPYLDLIEEFTLIELLDFHFKMRKLRPGLSMKELPELLELAHAKDKLIGNYSSGMRQRVKLGLAMFTEASFVFLDEPFTNLDEKAINWYKNQLNLITDSVIFVASNDPREYENSHESIKMGDFKF